MDSPLRDRAIPILQPMPRSSRATARLLRLLALPLFASAGAFAEDNRPALEFLVESVEPAVACTVDDLLPPHDQDISDMWHKETLVTPPFDCTCRTLKASYHCPNLGTDGYPEWIPRQVSSGACKPKNKNMLKKDPLPPGFRVLVYGNSHVRQVVEGIVCAYSSVVRTRKLSLVDGDSESTSAEMQAVGADRQCRSCVYTRKPMSRLLLNSGCVSEEDVEEACSCDTNESAFEFENGSVLHYHFAHQEEDKRIEDALEVHGTDWSDYDAVFANPGNQPRMEVSETLRAAGQLKEAGVPLFWLSAYMGEGDVGAWLPEQQDEFWGHGARFIPVHRMAETVQYLTRGVVEGDGHNPHFCLPGPPNEVGILLLKMAWALHDDKEPERAARGR